MSETDNRPTPASGIPAARATEPDAQPSEPSSEINMPAAQKVLNALEAIRDEAREREKRSDEREKRNDERFERIESAIVVIQAGLEDVRDETKQNTKNLGEQADALTRVASAAAKAADIGLQAKQVAGEASAQATQIVESAIRIHGASISVTVNDAVKNAVEPLKKDIEDIRTRDTEREKMMKQSNEAVGAIVDELGLADRVELGRDVRPGDKKSEPALQKIEKRAKHSTLVQLIVAIGVIVELILKLWPVATPPAYPTNPPALSAPPASSR